MTIENFIRKYGEDEGKLQFEKYKEKYRTFQHYYSKISKEFFDKLVGKLKPANEVFYAENERGLFDKENKRFFKYDFMDFEHKIIVEFNGVSFHAKSPDDPNFHNWIHPEQTAVESWLEDELKKSNAESNGFCYIVVWEDEYRKDKDAAINRTVETIRRIYGGKMDK